MHALEEVILVEVMYEAVCSLLDLEKLMLVIILYSWGGVCVGVKGKFNVEFP